MDEIKVIVGNYADVLYYIDTEDYIRRYNFKTGAKEKLFGIGVQKDFYTYKSMGYFLSVNEDIVRVSMVTGRADVIVHKVNGFCFVDGNIVYSKKIENESNESVNGLYTYVLDTNTLVTTGIGKEKIAVVAFVQGYAVYTVEAPVITNKNLYIKKLGTTDPAILIEKNIFEFCSVISNKLFYYIGSERNKSMININCDGTGRREWPLYTDEINFEIGDWVYFTRREGYNSVMCKSRIDGSDLCIIASDIEEFAGFENGYLYYINSDEELMKVRMDGSNLTELCSDVAEVLDIKEDKIIFVSYDYSTKVKVNNDDSDDEEDNFERVRVPKVAKSIYAVDFRGSGKIKLAYDVKSAKKYDDDKIYYIKKESIKSMGLEETEITAFDVLYALDVRNNTSEKIIEIKQSEKNTDMYMILMILGVVILFIGLFCLMGGYGKAGGLGTIVGIVLTLLGVMLKNNGD